MAPSNTVWGRITPALFSWASFDGGSVGRPVHLRSNYHLAVRGFNLLVFALILIGIALVVYVAQNGGIALGGYPGPTQPVQIHPPQPHIP